MKKLVLLATVICVLFLLCHTAVAADPDPKTIKVALFPMRTPRQSSRITRRSNIIWKVNWKKTLTWL